MSEQCARLRSWANQFDERADIDALAPLLARDLREAADTIEGLRDRLQAAELGWTCEYRPMWDDDDLLTGEYVGMWFTGCSDALVWNEDNDGCCEPPAWCPYCGGKVTTNDD